MLKDKFIITVLNKSDEVEATVDVGVTFPSPTAIELALLNAAKPYQENDKDRAEYARVNFTAKIDKRYVLA